MRLEWPFFGPDAFGTAEHFGRHVIDRIKLENINATEHGVIDVHKFQAIFYCMIPNADKANFLGQLLKAKSVKPLHQDVP